MAADKMTGSDGFVKFLDAGQLVGVYKLGEGWCLFKNWSKFGYFWGRYYERILW
jgi:hypothetical protein